MVEHVVQVIQKFLLGFEKAHGLLGAAFDFEWVHFVYNTLLEPALILIFVWCRRRGLQATRHRWRYRSWCGYRGTTWSSTL